MHYENFDCTLSTLVLRLVFHSCGLHDMFEGLCSCKMAAYSPKTHSGRTWYPKRRDRAGKLSLESISHLTQVRETAYQLA